MRPKGSAEALEVRRQIAGRLCQEGMGIRQVARLVGAAPASVFRWKKALEEGGKEALAANPRLWGEVSSGSRLVCPSRHGVEPAEARTVRSGTG